MTTKTWVVYSPEGQAERHSLPNARDLVAGADYTWKPGVAASVTDVAPFATAQAPSPLPQSQAVLDKVGGSLAMAGSAGAVAAAAAAGNYAEPENVVDYSNAAPAAAEDDVADEADEADADAEDDAPAAAPARRGRPRRNA